MTARREPHGLFQRTQTRELRGRTYMPYTGLSGRHSRGRLCYIDIGAGAAFSLATQALPMEPTARFRSRLVEAGNVAATLSQATAPLNQTGCVLEARHHCANCRHLLGRQWAKLQRPNILLDLRSVLKAGDRNGVLAKRPKVAQRSLCQ